MTEPASNPPVTLPVAHALPAPIVDVSTPDGWVVIVRTASPHFPQHQGKFGAEFWKARPVSNEEPTDEDGDVFVKNVELDADAEAADLIKDHHDVTQGMVGSGDGLEFDAAFFDTVADAAAASIKAAREQGATIDDPLADYINLLAQEADKMRDGLPVWADMVFKRDVLEATKRIGARDVKVAFMEAEDGRRTVGVEMVYRGEFYEVSYEPDGEHDDERQDVILTAIRDLPARAAADRAATEAEKPAP